MSFFPRVVGLDTDWTIWQSYLDGQTWGKGAGASRIQEDNIERIDQWTLRDRTDHAYSIKAFNDIFKVINDILKNGAQLAIITRNPAKNLSDRALYYFKVINPAGGNQRSIIELTKYNEVKDESKALAWRRIRERSGSDYADFLMFDDEASNNATRIILGVTFQLCRNKQGLTWDTYQQGLATWRRAKQLTLLTEPSTKRRRVLIGYTGLPTYVTDPVHKGEGIIDTSFTYRMGYALYVSDSFEIAKWFCAWDIPGAFPGMVTKISEVWVRDYDVWLNLNKVWQWFLHDSV